MSRGKKPAAITDRLWAQLEVTKGCWLWRGARNSSGYGWIGTGKHGKSMLVHRLVWMLFRGDPGDFYVLHHCDTPACANPDHLFLGTQSDNIADMDAKNRSNRYFSTARKINDSDLAEILASSESSRIVAQRYPITARTIRRLRQKHSHNQFRSH